jgi:hypothetical protein
MRAAGFTSRFKIDLNRINQWHQPLQQLLMNRMPSVGLQRRSVGKLHRAPKLISLRTRRKVDANPSLKQTGNLSLQSSNFRNRAKLMTLMHARLPPKRKSMNDHHSIVAKVCPIRCIFHRWAEAESPLEIGALDRTYRLSAAKNTGSAGSAAGAPNAPACCTPTGIANVPHRQDSLFLRDTDTAGGNAGGAARQ